MKKFPDAKVILSVRKTGEQWGQSFLGSVYRVCPALNQLPWSLILPTEDFCTLIDWVWRATYTLVASPSR